MIKRILTLALAVMMIATCSAIMPAGASEPAMTISIFTTRVTPDSKSEAMVRLQEKLGVKLEVTSVPDADYNTKINLFIASNDLPDLFAVPSSGDRTPLRAGASLTLDELAEYAPDVYSLARERAERIGISMDALVNQWSVDGVMRAFQSGKLNNSLPYGILVRTDVLADLGFDIPKTIGDWDAVMRAYKEKYPNSYPLTCMNGGDSQAFYMFLAAYGLRRDEWILRDDQLVYAPFEPQMRDALIQFHEWYEAGLVNPEYFSMYADNTAPRTELFNGNTFFYQYYNTSLQIQPPYDAGTIADQVVANFPQATFDWAPIPKLDGSDIKPVVANGALFGGSMDTIGIHLENNRDKVHKILSVVNMLSADEECYLLSRFGVEGQTYDMKDGVPVVRAEYSSNEARNAVGFGWLIAVDVDPQDALFNKFRPEYQKNQYETLIADPNGLYGRNTLNYIDSPRVNGQLTAPDGENLDVLNQSYLTQWNTMFTAVIVGQSKIEDFDALIAEWKDVVGNDMLQAANANFLQQWLK